MALSGGAVILKVCLSYNLSKLFSFFTVESSIAPKCNLLAFVAVPQLFFQTVLPLFPLSTLAD